ncbi:hypothetical protein OIU78_023010 [Salix suchowensis]|nr:hypothetical protein OIU78_023010 [Salix suchowensis]
MSSSSWKQLLYASSSEPMCVRTEQVNSKMAFSFHAPLFVSSMEQPPVRNRMLESIIDFSFPEYQFGPMDSVLTTMANEFLHVLNSCLTKSTAIKLALHPIPERLNALTSFLILYRFITRAVREGAGENKETEATIMPISDGETPVLAKSSSRVSKMISSISESAS